ncbi:hypothetical protein [Devosia lacusdianchii]|uniref:hypothetical protein n=1 Tax=Devosia lacusdianchii TaxID=2917991 RepID=UPI001F064414|nr:hypothetical protein [Devosia sp. JXJ CY 41]
MPSSPTRSCSQVRSRAPSALPDQGIAIHIFDGAYLLLETHSPECALLMADFVRNVTVGTGAGS